MPYKGSSVLKLGIGRIKILVVIPAYNEGKSIPTLIRKLKSFFDSKDIVVIDDGSEDNTYILAKKEGVNVIRHLKNQGKGRSLADGFQLALQKGYDGVITIDADLQHPVELIPRFLEEARFFDIVIGSRFENMSGMPWDRYFSNRVTSLVLSLLSGKHLEDTQSGYRYISTKVLKILKPTVSRFDFESEILFQAVKRGFRVGYVPLPTVYGVERSSIRKFRDTLRFIWLAVRLIWQ